MPARAVFLIDGVHKVDNIVGGVKWLCGEHDCIAAGLVWIGGSEKISDMDSYCAELEQALGAGVIVEGEVQDGFANPIAGLKAALEKFHPETVIQLSGAPQVNRQLMNRLAAVAVGYGASYVAGGTVFREKRVDFDPGKPSLGLYATDKRVGKTSFGIYLAALASGLKGRKTDWQSITITHSRGGPPEPPVLRIGSPPADDQDTPTTLAEIYRHRFTADTLEKLLDFGLHGASDVYEVALVLSEYLSEYEMLGNVAPEVCVIGCRRSGAGYFHEFAVSNVLAGLEQAKILEGNIIIHEGSGAEHPPVKVDGTVTLVPADADLQMLEDFPGLDTTDMVILVHCQPETADSMEIDYLEDFIRGRNPGVPIVRTMFETEVVGNQDTALENLSGSTCACFTTAPRLAHNRIRQALENRYSTEVVSVSSSLSRDKAMRAEIDSLMQDSNPPDTFLFEIKARGVEGVKYVREKYDCPTMYLSNIPREVEESGNSKSDNSNLDSLLIRALASCDKRYHSKKKG